MRTFRIAAIPGDGIGKEVIAAGVEVLEACAKRDGGFAVAFDHFDWGSERYKKTGAFMPDERPRPDQGPRRHPVRLGRRARRARPHHAVGPAARHLPALRPIRQRAPDPHPARHHQPAAGRHRPRARLGDRARELGGRICRRRRPRASRPARGGRHRRVDVHARRRGAHHALRLRARPLAAAQAADRRHQVQRPAPRHGDVGRDRGRGGRASSPTSPGTRCWSMP